MAACSCGNYWASPYEGDEVVEGHWLSCASWDAASLRKTLTPEQIEKRTAMLLARIR